MDDKLLKMARSLSAAEMKKLSAVYRNLKQLDALQKEEQALEKKLSAVCGKIAAITGGSVPRSAGARSKGRKRTGKSLAEHAVEALAASGGPMKVSEIAEAVLKAGYKSSSKNIKPMLYNVLSKRGDLVKLKDGAYKIGGTKKTTPAARPAVKQRASPKSPAKRKSASKAKQSAKGGKLPLGDKSLAEYAVEALAASNKPMRVPEIAAAVLKAGYKTRSKNLSRMLYNALPKRDDVVKLKDGAYKAGKALTANRR